MNGSSVEQETNKEDKWAHHRKLRSYRNLRWTWISLFPHRNTVYSHRNISLSTVIYGGAVNYGGVCIWNVTASLKLVLLCLFMTLHDWTVREKLGGDFGCILLVCDNSYHSVLCFWSVWTILSLLGCWFEPCVAKHFMIVLDWRFVWDNLYLIS